MAKKKFKPTSSAFAVFNVVYQDGAQTSNRKVPLEKFGPFDDEEDVARAFLEAQDRDIADKSGRPRGPIKTIERVG